MAEMSPLRRRMDARPRRPITRCHWCGRQCAGLVRQGFLRRRGRRRDLL